MLKLEYGKRYVDRCGRSTGELVEHIYNNNKRSALFPFLDPISNKCYTPTGRFYRESTVSCHDLIGEGKPMKDSKAAEDLFPGKGEAQDCKKIQDSDRLSQEFDQQGFVVKKHCTDIKSQESGGLDQSFNASGSKYLRKIVGAVNSHMDVYAVLSTFNVTCPARQHAIKKLLCSGLHSVGCRYVSREKGSILQDLQEARDAIDRAIQLHKTD